MIEFELVFAWLAVTLAIAGAGAPVALAMLPALGRYAVAFALPVGLLVVGLVGLWVGHLSIVAGLMAGIAVLGVAAAAAAIDIDGFGELRDGLPAVAVFLFAFAVMLWLRALDPAVDPASGEKFLDFGLLRAHLRATRLPAEDIWFAGEPFSYYYGGQYLVALLARAAGVSARYAYNLGLATFYATVVTAAYGLAGAIASEHDAGRWAGLLAAYLVGFAANLTTFGRILFWVLPEPISAGVANAVGAPLDWLALLPRGFHYWWASRLVPGMINEFPLFAYLNGDLHAHMLSAPFLLLGIAGLYSYFRAGDDRTYRRTLLFGALPATGGFVAVTNPWSLSTFLGFVWLIVYFTPVSPWTALGRDGVALVDRGRGLGGATLLTAVVAGMAVAASLPFWLVSESTGFGIGLLPVRSPLWALLAIHGPFLLVLGPAIRRWLDRPLRPGHYVAGALVLGVAWAVDLAGLVLFGGLVLAGWLALRQSIPVRAKQAVGDPTDGDPPAGASAESINHPTPGFEALMALGGFGLVTLVELVYLREPAAPGRFNTFFKTYADLWLLLSIPAAVVLGRRLVESRPTGASSVWSRWRERVPVAVAVALVVSTGVYGVGAVHEWTTADDPVRATDDPTIDALEFARDRYPDRMRAIDWLDARSGTPTVLSASGRNIYDGYRWVNAPSSITGLPT
ncbi:MAG: DUF2298 domain-containing protein, partial [Halobacteriales archaeon]